MVLATTSHHHHHHHRLQRTLRLSISGEGIKLMPLLIPLIRGVINSLTLPMDS